MFFVGVVGHCGNQGLTIIAYFLCLHIKLKQDFSKRYDNSPYDRFTIFFKSRSTSLQIASTQTSTAQHLWTKDYPENDKPRVTSFLYIYNWSQKACDFHVIILLFLFGSLRKCDWKSTRVHQLRVSEDGSLLIRRVSVTWPNAGSVPSLAHSDWVFKMAAKQNFWCECKLMYFAWIRFSLFRFKSSL